MKRGERSIVSVNFVTRDLKVKEGKHFENFDFFSKMTKKSKFKNLTFDPYNWGKFCKYGYSRGQGLPSDQVSTLNSYPYLRALS